MYMDTPVQAIKNAELIRVRLKKMGVNAAAANWSRELRSAISAEAAEMKRIAYIGGGAVRRMLNRKLSMAFEKWQAEAEQMKRELMFSLGLSF